MISIVKLIEHTPFNWGIMFVWILICMAECAWVWSNRKYLFWLYMAVNEYDKS